MVGLLIVGFIANLMVRSIDPKFHEAPDAVPHHEQFITTESAFDEVADSGKKA